MSMEEVRSSMTIKMGGAEAVSIPAFALRIMNLISRYFTAVKLFFGYVGSTLDMQYRCNRTSSKITKKISSTRIVLIRCILIAMHFCIM